MKRASVVLAQIVALSLLPLINCHFDRTCSPAPYGDGVGQEAVDRGSENIIQHGLHYIMPEWGEINCMGVVREWVFYTTNVTKCSSMTFSVWRPDGNDYRMVGRNKYEGPTEYDYDERVVFGVPANEQVPVYPGDVIGWSITIGSIDCISQSENASTMLFYNDNPSLELGGGRVTFDFSVNASISLHAVITEADPPVFGSLPYNHTIPWDFPDDNTIHTLIAQHPGNVLPYLANTALKDEVILEYHLDHKGFSIENDEVKANPVHGFKVGDVHLLHVTVTALGVSTTAILNVTITNTSSAVKAVLPNDVVRVNAMEKRKGDEVMTVGFTDAVDPGAVLFYFDHGSSKSTPPDYASPFSIDTFTGVIRCTMNLSDYKIQANTKQKSIEFQHDILVFDEGRYNTTTLTIEVTNTRQPLTFLNLANTVEFREDVRTQQPIYKVAVQQYHPDDTVIFEITSVSGYGRDLFHINDRTGEVYLDTYSTITPADYSVTIIATDGFYTTDPEILTVSITEMPEQPNFDPYIYYVSIPEKCGKVTPDDADCLPSWPIPGLDIQPKDYKCEPYIGFASNYLETTQSCEVQVKQTIDVDSYPELTSINMTVTTIADGDGTGPVTANARVFLSVTDINDQIPEIKNCNFSFEIHENTVGGVDLLTVQASDRDLTSPNNLVSFSLLDKEDDLSKNGTLNFEIGRASGIIITRQPVDFEEIRQIEFYVLAADGGTPQQSSSCSVNVTIIDVNDNHPQFECEGRPRDEPYPEDQDCFYNLDLPDDVIKGHTVQQLLATDIDTVTPETFYYLLVPDDTFLLQAEDGRIMVKREVERYTKYLLYCYSNDRGIPDLHSQVQSVRIDTYTPKWHYIDITMEMSLNEFNQTANRRLFMRKLRETFSPWHSQLVSARQEDDKTVATIYALSDNSTYLISNLREKKEFVHRNDMLKKMRKNIHGTPSDELQGEDYQDFLPIKVMPTFPNWWLDTVEGIATICALCFLFILILIALAIIYCWRKHLLCFQAKPSGNRWKKPIEKEDTPPVIPNYTEKTEGSARQRRNSPSPEPSQQALDRRPSLTSVDTIHTIIYDSKQ